MTTTRILIRSGKDPFDAVSTEQMMHRDAILSNSGNLLFQNSVHKLLLAADTEIVSNRGKVDPAAADRINDEFDVFAVPLANAFRPTFHRALTLLTQLIEKLTIPVVVIGVGGQAGLDLDVATMAALDESVQKFARAVLDRSATIGVRGEFTAEYLAHLGFRDTEVIGCPSMFLHGSSLDVRKEAASLSAASRIAVNVSRDSDTFVPMLDRAIERYPELVYFAQEMKDANLMYWGDLSEQADIPGGLPVHRTHPLLRDGHTRMHIDPAPWLEDLKGFDFSFGTRIHGNIAALLAGTPATVVCHDSRTLELCQYFSIPYCTVDSLPGDADPAELYAEADFGELLAGHESRFDRLLRFLDTNGLRNTYQHGDGGAEFERRQAATVYAPPIVNWDGAGDGDIGYRIARLRETDTALRAGQSASDKRVSELKGRAKQLESRLKSMEKRANDREQKLTAAMQRLAKSEQRLARLEQRSVYRRLRKLLRPVRRALSRRQTDK